MRALRAYMEADHEFLWFALGISSGLFGLALFSLLFNHNPQLHSGEIIKN